MGVSTDGQLCYGIPFPEGFTFPWEAYSEEEWWRKVNNYTPPFQIYNEEGQYLNGIVPTEKQFDIYFDHMQEGDKANPFPIDIANYCSGDSPMYILAVKDTVKSNSRGYPTEIDPATLKVTDEQRKVLLDFIEKYITANLDDCAELPELEPKWYLSSYWG